MKSFLGLLLMAASPLAAQTSSQHNIVFRVVLTTVASSPVSPPTGDPRQPPVIIPTPDAPVDPPIDPPTDPNPDSTSDPHLGCGGYSDAVTAMNHVYANLIYTQQIYTAAQITSSIDPGIYNSNRDALIQMQLYSQDIRDIIQIGGPQDIISQGVASISSHVAKLPVLLAKSPQLPLAPLVKDMQAHLTNISKLIRASSCAESLP